MKEGVEGSTNGDQRAASDSEKESNAKDRDDPMIDARSLAFFRRQLINPPTLLIKFSQHTMIPDLIQRFRHGLMLLLAVVSFTTIASADQGTDNETVILDPVEVSARRPDIEFTVRYDKRSTKVQRVRVKWVSSGAHMRGLRVGDRMTTIDGKPINDFILEEFLTAVKRELKAGESQTLLFEGRRFLFRRATISYTTELTDDSAGR